MGMGIPRKWEWEGMNVGEMITIPMGKFSRIFIVDQSGVIYWYSGRLIHTLGLHCYRHRPIVTKIFLSYFQSIVNGVLQLLLFNY